jgi:hypothetical protein
MSGFLEFRGQLLRDLDSSSATYPRCGASSHPLPCVPPLPQIDEVRVLARPNPHGACHESPSSDVGGHVLARLQERISGGVRELSARVLESVDDRWLESRARSGR